MIFAKACEIFIEEVLISYNLIYILRIKISNKYIYK